MIWLRIIMKMMMMTMMIIIIMVVLVRIFEGTSHQRGLLQLVGLTSRKGKTSPTVKLHNQWTDPATMKAAGLDDCLKISVVTT